jgi:hypothetical protein
MDPYQREPEPDRSIFARALTLKRDAHCGGTKLSQVSSMVAIAESKNGA